ncbi:hypothetical protein [Bradyrhizobium sp.]|uniref:hypothetical protein n=1 Tax=Bradyrhizobium sp. TaxID=376 RepID=UPI0040384DD8
MDQFKQFSLRDLAADFATRDPSFRYFHGKLYSFIPPEPQRFVDFIRANSFNKEQFPNAHPATLIFGKLGPLISNQLTQVVGVDEEKNLKMVGRIDKLELPDLNYLAIIAPANRTKNGETSYELAFESINFLRSFISLSFGKLPFYKWISNFDFDEKGVVSLSGEAFRMPLFSDNFKFVDLRLAKELSERLAKQLADYRKRLQRACNFFDMALDQVDEAFRFSSYWIALEIIVGGKSDAIRSKLAAAYGQKDKSFIDEKLRFREINQKRHDLMHKGEFAGFAAYQERLMQLYFWDIVIHQIGLRSRHLALSLTDSGLVEEEKRRMRHSS